MNWLPIVINLLLAIHVIVSLLIVLLVLMQRPKNEGLGAAFGGGMTENLFGAQTTNVLQTATRYLGGLFFALTLLLSYLYVKKSSGGGSALQRSLSAPTTIPAAPPMPVIPGFDGKLELPTATPAPLLEKTPEAVTDPVQPTPAPPVVPPAAPAPVPADKPAN